MSSRPQFEPNLVITNGNMASNITSRPTIIQKLPLVSYAIVWNGASPVGTVSVQGSNDYALSPGGTVLNAGTWNTLPLELNAASAVTMIPINGNSGNGMIDITNTGIYAIRLVYTATSGTGTMNVTIAAKVT